MSLALFSSLWWMRKSWPEQIIIKLQLQIVFMFLHPGCMKVITSFSSGSNLSMMICTQVKCVIEWAMMNVCVSLCNLHPNQELEHSIISESTPTPFLSLMQKLFSLNFFPFLIDT
jgi:hypothetical protein